MSIYICAIIPISRRTNLEPPATLPRLRDEYRCGLSLKQRLFFTILLWKSLAGIRAAKPLSRGAIGRFAMNFKLLGVLSSILSTLLLDGTTDFAFADADDLTGLYPLSGFTKALAVGINNSGTAVGYSTDANNVDRTEAYRLDQRCCKYHRNIIAKRSPGYKQCWTNSRKLWCAPHPSNSSEETIRSPSRALFGTAILPLNWLRFPVW